MRRVTWVWLLTLAFLLRAVVSLGVQATTAAASSSAPIPTPPILPDGKSESWGYDAAGRLNSLVPPGSGPVTYTLSHDGAGDLTLLSAPNGGEQTWSYDTAGRVTGTSWISGTTGLFTQTVTLDAAGQRTLSSNSWGTTSYSYDAAGRLTSASYPDGSTEAEQFDYRP